MAMAVSRQTGAASAIRPRQRAAAPPKPTTAMREQIDRTSREYFQLGVSEESGSRLAVSQKARQRLLPSFALSQSKGADSTAPRSYDQPNERHTPNPRHEVGSLRKGAFQEFEQQGCCDHSATGTC